jgi:hypothetical protein
VAVVVSPVIAVRWFAIFVARPPLAHLKTPLDSSAMRPKSISQIFDGMDEVLRDVALPHSDLFAEESRSSTVLQGRSRIMSSPRQGEFFCLGEYPGAIDAVEGVQEIGQNSHAWAPHGPFWLMSPTVMICGTSLL